MVVLRTRFIIIMISAINQIIADMLPIVLLLFLHLDLMTCMYLSVMLFVIPSSDCVRLRCVFIHDKF